MKSDKITSSLDDSSGDSNGGNKMNVRWTVPTGRAPPARPEAVGSLVTLSQRVETRSDTHKAT